MREDFLHYLWKYSKFNGSDLKTTNGESLAIISTGQYLELSGPDFFNSQLLISNQKWAGNVEMHLKSSDWYVHHHQNDANYNNVILHVVWEHDTPVLRKDNSEIPVLELKSYVDPNELKKYRELLTPKSWIFCEKELAEIDTSLFSIWLEALFFERLERKSILIENLLKQTQNDWEAVLFCLLAKNFGLNTNGEAFLKIAQSIPFTVFRKETSKTKSLEALLFGQAQLFPQNPEDWYVKELKECYVYLKHKYKLVLPVIEPVEFFRHRPDNFPTIRIAQLSALYQSQQNLFSALIHLNSVEGFYRIFDVNISDYWKSHYTFDKCSATKEKRISKSFVDLIIINTLIPLQFAYAKNCGMDCSEQLLELISFIAPEKNSVTEKFQSFGIASRSALETQSLLQLKKEYCDAKKCLQCKIGISLLRN